MNKMIERVAKAILETPNASDYKTLVAKNAIKAMREPTEEMCMVDTPDMPAGGEAKDIWYAMIDEILK